MLNPAEAVFEFFWDMSLSRIEPWKVSSGNLKQGWCAVDFSWTNPPLTIERKYDLDCSGFDIMILCMMLPRRTTLEVQLQTDKGEIRKLFPPEEREALQIEFELPLNGAGQIFNAKLTFYSPEPAAGHMRWFGLKNSEKLQQWLAYWEQIRSTTRWNLHLAENVTPSFSPSMGIVLSAEQLKALRDYHDAYIKKHGSSPFTRFAESIRSATPPESRIMEFTSHELRFSRSRDYKFWRSHGGLSSVRRIALTGAVLKDKELLELAARYAFSLASSGNWGTGVQGHIRGTNFDHRSFDEAVFTWDLVAALDLAGESLSPAGKTLLLRAIAERGIGQINYVVWRYPYIFDCNQLAAFSSGRLAGYLAMEKNWKHVDPYTELAKKELDSSFCKIFSDDGGFAEGPAYFQYTMSTGLPAYFMFANGRKNDFIKELPASIANTATYADVFISTCENQYFIPIGAANGIHGIDLTCAALMMQAFPDSQFLRLIKRFIHNRDGRLDSLSEFLWLSVAELPANLPPYKNFAILKSINTAASTRKAGEHQVKLLIIGDCSSMRGHRHDDAGAFVLEFAGETFAMDSGSTSYIDPWSLTLKKADRHNVLMPLAEHTSAQTKYVDTPLSARGDEQRFSARMELDNVWTSFKSWTRSWDSPRPDEIIITDEYELKDGEGVIFNWVTMLPATHEGSEVKIQGKNGLVRIQVPESCTVKISQVDYIDHGPIQTRIGFIRRDTAGKMQVRIRLEPKK
ncbi:MAG: heparinase II/III family protein [Victivallales bacterium]|nr:heparinase II/III family protein [Victivallales bacterium]